MKMTQVKYMTNFENIWKTKCRYTKMLNRVLIVLLRIYLAPERERKKKERLQEIATKDNTKITRKSYYTRRNMIKNERKKQNKYLQKAQEDAANRRKWKTKAINCDKRINTFIQALSIDVSLISLTL